MIVLGRVTESQLVSISTGAVRSEAKSEPLRLEAPLEEDDSGEEEDLARRFDDLLDKEQPKQKD